MLLLVCTGILSCLLTSRVQPRQQAKDGTRSTTFLATAPIHRIFFSETFVFKNTQEPSSRNSNNYSMQRQSNPICLQTLLLFLLAFLAAATTSHASLQPKTSPAWSTQRFGVRKTHGKTDRERKHQALAITGRKSAIRQSRQEGLSAADTNKQQLLIELLHSVRF
jgi:hypothetical protein